MSYSRACFETKRSEFRRHSVGQVNAVGCLAFNQRGEHRNCVDHPGHVSKDRPGLLAITGNNHDRAALAGCQIFRPVSTRREKRGDQRQDQGFPATAPTINQASLVTPTGGTSKPGATLKVARSASRHRQTEQRLQEHIPCRQSPAVSNQGANSSAVVDGIHDADQIGRRRDAVLATPSGAATPSLASRQSSMEIPMSW